MARVLIVEDLAELADEMRATVPPGHTVVHAASREVAVGELGRMAADLVITALVLETGDYEDGVAVTEAAMMRNPACRVILVCSYSTPETCIAAIRAGVFAYLERNSPGLDFTEMLRWQVRTALGTSAPGAVSRL